jgi:hypothetical protein
MGRGDCGITVGIVAELARLADDLDVHDPYRR